MRERIGVGTSDMAVATDLNPPSAATEADRPGSPEPAEGQSAPTRDMAHGRGRVRSYIGSASNMPRGIDPEI